MSPAITLSGIRYFDAEQCLVAVHFCERRRSHPISIYSFALHEVPFSIVRPRVGLTFSAVRVLRKVPCQRSQTARFL
jgi:hypothetical protein